MMQVTVPVMTETTIKELEETGNVKGCLLINSGKECYNRYTDLSHQIKIELGDDALSRLKRWCDKNAVTTLPISLPHCNQLQSLPFHHRDPFDRLIIAQSICEKLNIVTIDEHFSKYDVAVIWS